MLKKNDIVQITASDHQWYPCLIVVEEVKEWGVQGYIAMPTPQGVGEAWIRLKNEEIEKVGEAIICHPDTNEKSIDV